MHILSEKAGQRNSERLWKTRADCSVDNHVRFKCCVVFILHIFCGVCDEMLYRCVRKKVLKCARTPMSLARFMLAAY
jgi:hypothetical protein